MSALICHTVGQSSGVGPFVFCFFIAVIKQGAKATQGGESLFGSQVIDYLGLEFEAEVTEEHSTYLLVTSGLLSYFPYTVWAHLPRDVTTHSGLEPLTSISHYKNASQKCLQANLGKRSLNCGSLIPNGFSLC